MKVSSRDILDVLRRYEMAGDENVPRQIEMIKMSNPRPINTLVSFQFNKCKFYILFDNADDDVEYVISQIKTKNSNVIGNLILNPTDSNSTYALPYKGKECYLFEVKSNKARLDSELAKRYPENSRSTWQKHIKSGHISVNERIITSSKYEVADIDKISIDLPEMQDYSQNKLPIIYIDDNVIVINKPSGILSHAKGAISEEFTVADFFKGYCTFDSETNRPGIIHRLDRDTSGVMIGARNSETAQQLKKQFSNRKIKKIYYAILVGTPKLSAANIDLPIGRNPSAPSTFRVDTNGKPAVTKYEVIESNDEYSLVKLQPQTGRTHQLRVHMKYIGTPILGDKIYGKADERMYLHAYSLEVTIPIGNRRIFISPIPIEFMKYFPEFKL